MLKAFLEHHENRAHGGLITNAVQHCHAMGVSSVVLHDEPGNRIRLFHATKDHTLGVNAQHRYKPMTIAFHPHHCAITLLPIFGRAVNHTVYLEPVIEGDLYECRYESALTGKGGQLVPEQRRSWRVKSEVVIELPAAGWKMRAEELHTVSVEEGREAAWLVFEGEENPEYRSVCYTNNPNFDASGMYVKRPECALEALHACLRAIRDGR